MKMTPLQQSLDPGQYRRTFDQGASRFLECGIDFKDEIRRALSKESKQSAALFLDVGCGAGLTIEQLVRTVRLLFKEGKNCNGIGVDLQPHPEVLRNCVSSYTNSDPRQPSLFDVLDRMVLPPTSAEPFETAADFVKGSACALPIASNSVRLGYSIATLLYVTDSLRALAEGYRVLEPGGVFLWDICDRDISAGPRFENILQRTPGAEEVFSYHPSMTDPRMGTVKCVKPHDNETFTEFPFEVGVEVLTAGAQPGTRAAFQRNALYRPRLS